MCQTSPVRFVSGDKGMTWLGRWSAMLSNSSNSNRVAPAEWMAKLIPSGLTVGPRGSGEPGSKFVSVGMKGEGGRRPSLSPENRRELGTSAETSAGRTDRARHDANGCDLIGLIFKHTTYQEPRR